MRQKYLHLGDLELKIMNIIWDKDCSCSVSEVHEILYPGSKLAYTTVMTVMGNLHKKGVLERKKEGKAFIYVPARKREEVAQGAIRNMAQVFYQNNLPEFFKCFLNSQKKLNKEEIKELKKKLEDFEKETGES